MNQSTTHDPHYVFFSASVLLCLTVLLFSRQSRKPLPEGISYLGKEHPASDIEFLADLTYVDKNGVRKVEQEIFDEIFGIIASARCFIVVGRNNLIRPVLRSRNP